jgi:hypothetical protein
MRVVPEGDAERTGTYAIRTPVVGLRYACGRPMAWMKQPVVASRCSLAWMATEYASKGSHRPC